MPVPNEAMPNEAVPNEAVPNQAVPNQAMPFSASSASSSGGSVRIPIRPVDLSGPQRVHLIGIGGAGISAIATVLAAMGHLVSGSDLKESAGLESLRALGVEVSVGHDAAQVGRDVDIVARSTAIPDNNPEVVEALSRNIAVYSRAELLTAITSLRHSIAVAGTHGKTTTSSMLAVILREADQAPSFIIGGEVNEIGSGAVWDDGATLIVEADESDGTFLVLDSGAAIVTSVDPDHLDFYGSVEALRATFVEFLGQAAGSKVVCIDDVDAQWLVETVRANTTNQDDEYRPITTYGFDAAADYQITEFSPTRTGSTFTIAHGGSPLCTVELLAPGLHNARNATGALICAVEHGVAVDLAVRALTRYSGVARRFEFRGTAAGVTFVDDYAHLPLEVELTLGAAQAGEWGRTICIFQPHRYTRTSALGSEFRDSFVGADRVIITGIYSAGELPIPGVSGQLVADAVIEAHPELAVTYVEHRADLVAHLLDELVEGDLCLTLGAGDLTSLPDELQHALENK